MKKLINFFKDDEGAGLVEYALLVALIAIATIAAIKFLQNGIENVFNNAAGELNSAT